MQRIDKLNAFRQLLDSLDMQVQGGKKVPLTNFCTIDQNRVVTLINTIKSELPTVIVQAEGIVNNEKVIIDEANEHAMRIKGQAQALATQYLQDAKQRAAQYEDASAQKANEALSKAQQNAAAITQEAEEQVRAMLAEANAKANQMVSEQEVLTRAKMEADNLQQATQEEVGRLYSDVYSHIDDVLAQLDRTISEKLTDIRLIRQQIDQSMH